MKTSNLSIGVEGRPHGYLDRGANRGAGTSFVKDGAPAVDKIIEFLDCVL